jgi:hypothetical protein
LNAGDFLRKAGYPSIQESISLVEDGNFIEIPHTGESIRRHFEISGQSSHYYRGRTTESSSVNTKEVKVHLERQSQEMTTDVMYANGLRFLISVLKPLDLVICSHLNSLGSKTLGQALQSQVNLIRSRGFEIMKVVVEAQPFLQIDGRVT